MRLECRSGERGGIEEEVKVNMGEMECQCPCDIPDSIGATARYADRYADLCRPQATSVLAREGVCYS